MEKDKKKEKIDLDIPIVVPSNIPKIYCTGAYGKYGSYDFRLLLYSEEPLQQDKIINPNELDVVREVLAQIILSPLAAKQTADWLIKNVQKFEEENGIIPEPSKSKNRKII
jgi:hypothetical protein